MYTLYLSKNAWGWTERELFTSLADYLTSTSRPTRVHEQAHFRLPSWFGILLRRPIEESAAYLVHDRTGTYWLMVCEDWADGSLEALRMAAADRRCRLILKQQYREPCYDVHVKEKLRPWTYTAMLPTKLQRQLAQLRKMKPTCSRLYWRGSNDYAQRRAVVERLARHKILATGTGAIPYEEYCVELRNHHVALALPGWGNLCHREIEAFGAGTPVLMPRLLNQLHNDLVPDYHYISVDVEVDRDSPDEIAGAIERRYREVSDAPALLRQIAANALAWYDENAAFPAALRLTVDLLGLPD